MKNTKMWLLMIGGMVICIGIVFFMIKPSIEQRPNPSVTPSPVVTPITTSQTSDSPPTYKGEILGGKNSLYLNYVREDYNQALQSNKLVVLYFYANWCPVCREEFSQTVGAFDALPHDGVIGFRVNFNDNQTDDDERNLARNFGVAYQHTKVFLKHGERILKSPEPWDQARYLEEINKVL